MWFVVTLSHIRVTKKEIALYQGKKYFFPSAYTFKISVVETGIFQGFMEMIIVFYVFLPSVR